MNCANNVFAIGLSLCGGENQLGNCTIVLQASPDNSVVWLYLQLRGRITGAEQGLKIDELMDQAVELLSPLADLGSLSMSTCQNARSANGVNYAL